MISSPRKMAQSQYTLEVTSKVYALIVAISDDYTLVHEEIFDALGIYYGLAKIKDQERWKMGTGKYALGYFTSQADAQRIMRLLQLDPDVKSGLATIQIVQQDISALQLYQTVKIEVNKFYPESCVEGPSSPPLAPMSPEEAVAFLSR